MKFFLGLMVVAVMSATNSFAGDEDRPGFFDRMTPRQGYMAFGGYCLILLGADVWAVTRSTRLDAEKRAAIYAPEVPGIVPDEVPQPRPPFDEPEEDQ